MKLVILLLAIVAILCVSCKDNSTNSPTGATEIWPLKIGNFWVMKATSYDSLGQILNTETDSMIVVRDTVFNNETAYVLHEITNKGLSSVILLNRYNGLNFIFEVWNAALQKDSIMNYLAYKYPGTSGEIYTALQNQDTMKILSTDTVIHSFNDASFNCYEYLYLIVDYNYYYNEHICFSPGVGPVCDEEYNLKANGSLYLSYKTELQSYKVQ